MSQVCFGGKTPCCHQATVADLAVPGGWMWVGEPPQEIFHVPLPHLGTLSLLGVDTLSTLPGEHGGGPPPAP